MKTVVITGGSAGIGFATARAFARKGYAVGLIARGAEKLRDAAKTLRDEEGATVLDVTADVADSEALEAAASRIEGELGPIDVWVNNAMITVIAPFGEISAEDFRRITEVNYLGQVHGMKAALSRFRSRDAGAIVNVGSGLAYRGIPLQSAYCATKHAVKAATESLRTELRHEGSRITVSLVHPSGINTPQFGWARTSLPNQPQPNEPIFQPETVAKAIVRAAEKGPRELFVGTPALGIAALGPLMPALLDRQMASSGFDAQTSDQSRTRSNRGDGYTDDPVAGDARARGAFDHKAKSSAAIIDGDRGRFALFAVGAAAMIGVGAAMERLRPSLRPSRRDRARSFVKGAVTERLRRRVVGR